MSKSERVKDPPNQRDSPEIQGAPTDRLSSWKEIAVHFGRTVRTVQRWEQGCEMPIHRHGHQVSSSVYAFRSELDAWWLSRDQPHAAGEVEEEDPATKRRPIDVSTQELYLMARDEWNSRTLDGIRRSMALARQLTERDPAHGQAHAMQALAGVVLASYTPEPAARPIALARQAACRAVEIDESLADAHTALGLIHLAFDWRWTDAEQSLRRAIELKPKDATAWSWLGFWSLSRGSPEQALVDTRRAERMDPESLIIKTQVAWVLYFMRRYPEALDQLEKTLAANPRFWRAYLNAGWCYIAMGRSEDALRALEMAYALNDYPLLRTVIARAHAQGGAESDARRALSGVESTGRHISWYFLAQSRLALGEQDEAARLLMKACDEKEWHLIFMRADPGLDEIRNHPSYLEVVDRLAF